VVADTPAPPDRDAAHAVSPVGVPTGPVITIASGALDTVGVRARAAAPAHRYVVVTDDRVGPLYASRVVASFSATESVDVLAMPHGEGAKTRATWSRLTDELLALGCGRDTTIIALGGGVVGDLAGFVAATYMRGIPILQVPTTLLAMIDAAIGGKTAVDTPAGKNLVGAFHPPAAVVVDPSVLSTLPPRQLRAGIAEAIKHGVIADAEYFARTEADLPGLLAPGNASGAAMGALIAGSIAIKSAVVAEDAQEHGRRKILNFGHTIGHAVEAASGFALLHGEAVAIGMAIECRLAELSGAAVCGITDQVCAALDIAGLPTIVPADLDGAAIVRLTHSDKKARAGAVEYALPHAIGEMAAADSGWAVPLPDAFVREALA
jgi:3-dehydroquinate synthase